jgi:hypothetical protein
MFFPDTLLNGVTIATEYSGPQSLDH